MNLLNQIINKCKNVVVPLIFLSFCFIGCDSVKTTDMDANKIPTEEDRGFQGKIYKINSVTLKDSTEINLKDKNPEIIWNGSSKVLAYDLSKTKRGIIPLENIKSANVDIVKGNYITPIAIVAGFLVYAGVMVLIVFIWLLP